MILIETLKGLALFLLVVALLIFVVIGAELAYLMLREILHDDFQE